MTINNHEVEFIKESHQYLVDGVLVPSVTTILNEFYNTEFKVSENKLKIAGQLGTQMHKEIEDYERYGTLSNSLEFKNYLFLKEKIGFENIENEVIVLYEENGKVLFIGTLDQIIKLDDLIGVNDFKRVSSFNKEKVAIQTTLYSLGYEQTYNKKVDFVSGTHLKNEIRKFNKLNRCDKKALKMVYEYYERKNENV